MIRIIKALEKVVLLDAKEMQIYEFELAKKREEKKQAYKAARCASKEIEVVIEEVTEADVVDEVTVVPMEATMVVVDSTRRRILDQYFKL
ncbi:hypothetical protein Plhal304r1_c028g0093081 [Plasmopara halstedii]